MAWYNDAMLLRRRVGRIATVLGFALVAAACGSSGDDGGTETISVPGDAPTIQEAVDRATAGDLVLIEPGVYREQVVVETDGLVIRGADRNDVVLDGGDELFDGFLVVANDVAVENLTVRNFRQNGVIFTGSVSYGADEEPVKNGPGTLEGYRISHVTAHNNGTYGIYAFASRDGLIENSYASGNPDSGFYVGQCKPCDVVLRDVTAERNSIGYYGTNASGGVFVVESTFRDNRLGLTPNSQLAERLAPQVGTVIAGNLVVDNDSPDAPAIANGFFGGGIAIGGGRDNIVIRNLVTDHAGFGIGVVPLDGFAAEGNRIEGNTITGNGVDIVIDSNGDPLGNCLARNTFDTAAPAGVVDALGCGGPGSSFDPFTFVSPTAPPDVDWRMVAAPSAQPTMPDARTAAPTPVAGAPGIDVDAIELPSR